MTTAIALERDSAAYPSGLRALPGAPSILYTSGAPLEAERVVAIVGTRAPAPACEAFARTLATELARRGVVVASGGAVGIDTAAHEATLAAGGRTWVVAPHGSGCVYPKENANLIERVKASRGAVLWPFEADARPATFRFWVRNGVMVALADALVVVQAGIPSGTLNAAKWARRLGKPVWVVPTPPWIDGCEGSWSLLEAGAKPLYSLPRFMAALRGDARPSAAAPPQGAAVRELSPDEADALATLSAKPKHADQIAEESGVPISRLATALLTLALENVVVEGPSGFYCRCN